MSSNFRPRNRHVADLVRFHIPQKLGEGDFLFVSAHHVVFLEQLPQNQKARNDEHPEQYLFNGRVHLGRTSLFSQPDPGQPTPVVFTRETWPGIANH
jgi:hypothetical protein